MIKTALDFGMILVQINVLLIYRINTILFSEFNKPVTFFLIKYFKCFNEIR